MIELTRILVPIALSPSCSWAAQYSAQLASQFGSKLMFLYVGNSPRGTIETFLTQAVKDTSYEITICRGDPADAIVRFASETSPSLIVMPTHAHGRFRRFLLGSVTAKVLHDVECPVLTGVHHEAAPLSTGSDIRQIVCGVDADEGFVPVVNGALAFAQLFDAKLTVVHAIPAADETSDNRGEIEVRKYLFRLAEEKLAQLKRDAEADVTILLVGGAVSTVIREAALRTGAELVVIGRGHTQRELGRLRTQAYSIIRHSPCPVLSI